MGYKYKLVINGVYWGYNLLTNHLLSSWDIQAAVIRTRRTKTCPTLEVEAAAARQDLEVCTGKGGVFIHPFWNSSERVFGSHSKKGNETGNDLVF